MKEPSSKAIADTLRAIENAERGQEHPRTLARKAVAQYRTTTNTALDYDFDRAPKELKQVVYNVAVRFSRRRLWARLLR